VGGNGPVRWGECARLAGATGGETPGIAGKRPDPRCGMGVAQAMTATSGGFPGHERIGSASTMDGTKRAASTTSLRALDALNVFLADVRDGLRPYLAIT
jgi:hypothetical protein